MWPYKMRGKDREYLFPVFKFGKKEHAKSMLDHGEVRIGTFHEFSDKSKYGGLIYDSDEGKLQIVNKYTRFVGSRSISKGVLRLFGDQNDRLDITDSTFQYNFELRDMYVFCASSYFFSDTLKWSLEEGKNASVLITDLGLFADRADPFIADSTRVGFGPCQYKGRKIEETDPGPDSETELLLANQRVLCFLKPTEYQAQREARIVWQSHPNSPSKEPKLLRIPALKELFLPVEFPSIDQEKLSSKTNRSGYGVKLRLKSGKSDLLIINEPKEFFTPVIFDRDSKPHVGFTYINFLNGPVVVKDGLFVFSKPALFADGLMIWLIHPLDEVEGIEFFFEADWLTNKAKIDSEFKIQPNKAT